MGFGRLHFYLATSTLIAVAAIIDSDGLGGALVLAWSLWVAFMLVRQTRRARPDGPSILPLLAWVGVLLSSGVVVRAIHGLIVREPFPLPSPADLLHFPAYVLIAALLWRLYRSRSTRRDVDSWLDGIAIAHAIVIVAWVSFYGGFLQDASIPEATRLANAPYDLIIVFSAVLVLRVNATPGDRPQAYRLLAWTFAAFVIVDLAAAVSLARGNGLSVTVALSPFAGAFAVAAAQHPSVHEILRPQRLAEIRFSRLRLALISFAIAAPILVLLARDSLTDLDLTVLSILVASLTAIMTTRAVRMVRDQQRSVELERVLGSEVSHIAQLDPSSADLREAVAASTRKLLPPQAHVAIATQRPKSEDVWFAGLLLDMDEATQREYLIVRDHRPTAREQRILHTLTINVETSVRSSRAKVLNAKAESAADAARQIAINEQRFRALVQNASDLVIVLDEDAVIAYISDASGTLLGYEPKELEDATAGLGIVADDTAVAERHFQSFIAGDPVSRNLEIRARHKDGTIRLLDCTFTDMRGVEGVEGIVVNATDVTELRTLEQDLLNAETTDPLTLLLNRKAFLEEVSLAMRRSSLKSGHAAIAIININDFREINKGVGPILADRLLVEVAHAIRNAVRLPDAVARLSGDEFAILLPNVLGDAEAIATVERIVDEIAKPISVGGKEFRLLSAAGIAVDTHRNSNSLVLLRQADTATDVARKSARTSAAVAIYQEQMGKAASERVEIRNRLEQAIRNFELRLVYQPVVEMATGKIISMEALSRWRHPDRGEISPAVFIPIAESAGLINELGEWALETACHQLVEWTELGRSDLSVSVNMSGEQLRSDDVIARVGAILTKTGAPASRIVIEITESVLIDDTDFIADRINALQAMGLRLAIDDFGTGYSSLSYLQRYEFDVLKIDRSFVHNIQEDQNKRRSEIIRAIVSLANGLDAITIAEGVEDEHELEQLRGLGCEHAQGFFLHRPLELKDIARVLHLAADSPLAA